MIPTRFNPLGSPPYLRRVAYLGASGTQYINTGITPGADFTAEITFSVVTGTNISCGGRQGYTTNEFRITANGNGQIDFAFGNAAGSYYGQDFSFFRSVLFGMDGKLYIDGTLIAERSGTFSTFYPFYIFQFNNGNSSTVGGTGGRISRAILKTAGTKVRDLIPVLDKSGVPCMYDRVTNRLFYNAGTGTFNYA